VAAIDDGAAAERRSAAADPRLSAGSGPNRDPQLAGRLFHADAAIRHGRRRHPPMKAHGVCSVFLPGVGAA